jgi:hypothetical protein
VHPEKLHFAESGLFAEATETWLMAFGSVQPLIMTSGASEHSPSVLAHDA